MEEFWCYLLILHLFITFYSQASQWVIQAPPSPLALLQRSLTSAVGGAGDLSRMAAQTPAISSPGSPGIWVWPRTSDSQPLGEEEPQGAGRGFPGGPGECQQVSAFPTGHRVCFAHVESLRGRTMPPAVFSWLDLKKKNHLTTCPCVCASLE